MIYAYGTKLAGGVPTLTSAPGLGPTLPTVFLGGLPLLYKEEVFTVAGTYVFTVPYNVRHVSVLCVGGGNGAGSSITSTGTSHFNEAVVGFGSNNRTGGGFVGQGGGNGGLAGISANSTNSSGTRDAGGGGGGAGGYSGNGGAGSNGTQILASISAPGNFRASGGGGGGVGLYGEYRSGQGGISGSTDGSPGTGGAGGGGGGGRATTSPTDGSSGEGGSGGTPYNNTTQIISRGVYGGGTGGFNGEGDGGGGLGWANNLEVSPGQKIPIKVGTGGAVRIIWGAGRAFPFSAQ